MYTAVCEINSRWEPAVLYRETGSRPAVMNTGGMGAAGGGKEVQEGEDICIHMADSACCIAEINTAL